MTYIDSAILNLIESVCRRFQLLTGRTNVWLAVQLTNLSIIVYFMWAGLYFWSRNIAVRIALGLFCGGLLYLLTQTVFKVPIEAYEDDAYRRVAKGFRNPRRIRDARLRISFLTLSLMLFYPALLVYLNLHVSIVLLTYLLIVLTTVVLYLLACDPLPPCTGKVMELLGARQPMWVAGLKPSGPKNISTTLARQAEHRAVARGFGSPALAKGPATALESIRVGRCTPIARHAVI